MFDVTYLSEMCRIHSFYYTWGTATQLGTFSSLAFAPDPKFVHVDVDELLRKDIMLPNLYPLQQFLTACIQPPYLWSTHQYTSRPTSMFVSLRCYSNWDDLDFLSEYDSTSANTAFSFVLKELFPLHLSIPAHLSNVQHNSVATGGYM